MSENRYNFFNFYKNALRLNSEDFSKFEESLNIPLPHTFRITDSPDSENIRNKLKEFPFLKKLEYLKDLYTFQKRNRVVCKTSTNGVQNVENSNYGNTSKIFTSYDYDNSELSDLHNESYPETSIAFKNKDSDLYNEFVDFLISHTDIGNIQRQEVVSMIPHIFLNLKPTSRVFEPCAAPGSKTKQILEIVKDGLVVSNDCNPIRTNVLISESTKKSHMGFLVTCMDASSYPTLYHQMSTVKSDLFDNNNKHNRLLFDRICCDVPCSSDGTIRKTPQILDKWSISKAIGLCNLQERILRRSLEMLENGGICVYSTCSLNPIENEYVVNKVIGDNDLYEIVDADPEIFCHKRTETSGNATESEAYADDLDKAENNSSKIIIRRGIEEFSYEKYSYSNPKMGKCVRILPHDQDTGGFFIAAIKKKPDMNMNSLSLKMNSLEIHQKIDCKSQVDITSSYINNTQQKSQVESKLHLESGFYEATPEIYSEIFRKYNTCHKLISMSTNYKNLYAISNQVYEFIANNRKAKIIYCGIKAYNWQTLSKKAYRIKSEFLNRITSSSKLEGSAVDNENLSNELGEKYNQSENTEIISNKTDIINQHTFTSNKTSFKCDVEISLSDFGKLLKKEVVPTEELHFEIRGLFTCNVHGLNYKFCGFSSNKKVFLYIDKNVRKALMKLY